MTEKYSLYLVIETNFAATYILSNVLIQLFARVPEFKYAYLFHLSIYYYRYASIAIAIMKISSHSSKSCSYRERSFYFFILYRANCCVIIRRRDWTRLMWATDFFFLRVYKGNTSSTPPAPTPNAPMIRR